MEPCPRCRHPCSRLSRRATARQPRSVCLSCGHHYEPLPTALSPAAATTRPTAEALPTSDQEKQ